MRAIFLNKRPEKIESVYSENVIARLEKSAGLERKVMTPESLERCDGVRYIFSTWGMPDLTEQEIEKYFPDLEAVFYAAGSVQKFARPFLNRGIKVFSAWAANAVPVAEFTVAQIILANKGYFQSCAEMSHGDYENAKQFRKENCRGNYGAKIGIIGAGQIGKLVIKMLKSYHLTPLVFDPFLSDEQAKELGVRKTDLETLFSECQVVSNHLANNEQTKGMLDGHLFELMRRGATFINTGRGAQVREDEMAQVFEKRRDLTALLDVTYPEPPEADSPLYSLPNVFLSPHIAGSLADETYRMAEYMADEFEALVSGKPTRFEVSEKMLETMA